MIILSGNCPRHHNAIMLELTDFDDSKISYLARISRGHHVDTLLVPREYKGTFISYASNGITLSDEGTCK